MKQSLAAVRSEKKTMLDELGARLEEITASRPTPEDAPPSRDDEPHESSFVEFLAQEARDAETALKTNDVYAQRLQDEIKQVEREMYARPRDAQPPTHDAERVIETAKEAASVALSACESTKQRALYYKGVAKMVYVKLNRKKARLRQTPRRAQRKTRRRDIGAGDTVSPHATQRHRSRALILIRFGVNRRLVIQSNRRAPLTPPHSATPRPIDHATRRRRPPLPPMVSRSRHRHLPRETRSRRRHGRARRRVRRHGRHQGGHRLSARPLSSVRGDERSAVRCHLVSARRRRGRKRQGVVYPLRSTRGDAGEDPMGERARGGRRVGRRDVDALPRDVDSPVTGWTNEEIGEMQFARGIGNCAKVKARDAGTVKKLMETHGEESWAKHWTWALARACASRAVDLERGESFLAPVLDMLNHSHGSANVKWDASEDGEAVVLRALTTVAPGKNW